MKFSEKIIYSCLVILAIMFSIGMLLMIYQNHVTLLKTTRDQYLSHHQIELYTLESRLFQDSISLQGYYSKDNQQIQNKMIYYVQQFQDVEKNGYYALIHDNNQILYTDMNENLKPYISSEHNHTYFMQSIQKNQYMFVTSSFTVGTDIYYLETCYDMSFVYKERDRQLQSFLIIGCFLLVVASFILKVLSNYLTRSILKLNEVSKRIASGQYSERTCIQSQDEIGELSQSFEYMAQMNEQRIQQLQDNVLQKEEFMASFSHEIKTPMTAILGFADLLRTCDCDEETRQKAAQYIYHEGRRLESLAYTLMDLLALNNRTIQCQCVKIKDVIKQIKNYYLGQNKQERLVIEYDDVCVLSQGELLFVLLRNLIDNALKASQDNQYVKVSIHKCQQHVIFSIRDQGIGMSQEAIEKATEPFYMADKSRSRSMGGAGLGLTIVKRILELHHSSLQIQSQLNNGTTMSFALEVNHEKI